MPQKSTINLHSLRKKLKEDVILETANRISHELETKEGKTIVTFIESELIKRIEILMSQDPEAQVLLSLISKLGHVFNTAQKIVNRKIFPLKKETN